MINEFTLYGLGGRERVKEELDPMDPAAYSDIPRYICKGFIHTLNG